MDKLSQPPLPHPVPLRKSWRQPDTFAWLIGIATSLIPWMQGAGKEQGGYNENRREIPFKNLT